MEDQSSGLGDHGRYHAPVRRRFQMAISAWNWTVSLDSPDGKYNASIEWANEIAMGAPTSGQLEISNNLTFPACSPSIAWSNNSLFLAVPQWQAYDNGHRQRLMIVSMDHRKFQLLDDDYSVLEIESFTNNIVQGVNSPAHNPRLVTVDTSGIAW